MDGTGEQREEFGRRREPNTISWEVHESRCRGRNEFPQCGSTGIFRIPGVGGAQLGDFTTSLPPLLQPSQLQALIPGRESAAGAVQQPCYLSHTHRGNSSTTAALRTAPAGKIPPAQPVLLFPGAFPSDSHSTALQGMDLNSAVPTLPWLSSPNFPPRTRGWQRKEEEAARDLPQLPAKQQPPSGVCCCTSKKKP